MTTPMLASTSRSMPSTEKGVARAARSARATLVAAGPRTRHRPGGDGVDAAQHPGQAGPDLSEQFVAVVVAEGVIDLREAVQVQQQQPGAGPEARTPVDNRPIPPWRSRSMASMLSAPATIPATRPGTFRCAFTPGPRPTRRGANYALVSAPQRATIPGSS